MIFKENEIKIFLKAFDNIHDFTNEEIEYLISNIVPHYDGIFLKTGIILFKTDERYFMINNNNIIRELTYEEFLKQQNI